jgi:predicted DNA binding CopG/RHH family protein
MTTRPLSPRRMLTLLINAPQKREAAPMVSVRIPQPLIDASKAEAARRGIPYSVLFREALVAMLRKETD